jgi:hypothetical protein
MRITIEIPDRLHSRLRRKAKAEACTVAELILEALEASLVPDVPKPRRVRPPIIRSKRPGTLYLDNAKIFEIIDFP